MRFRDIKSGDILRFTCGSEKSIANVKKIKFENKSKKNKQQFVPKLITFKVTLLCLRRIFGHLRKFDRHLFHSSTYKLSGEILNSHKSAFHISNPSFHYK